LRANDNTSAARSSIDDKCRLPGLAGRPIELRWRQLRLAGKRSRTALTPSRLAGKLNADPFAAGAQAGVAKASARDAEPNRAKGAERRAGRSAFRPRLQRGCYEKVAAAVDAARHTSSQAKNRALLG